MNMLRRGFLYAFLILPVTSLILHPEGRNNEITLTEGKTQTFTCTTDSSRPASWINWYFDNTNVTNLANIVTTSDVTDNTTFISSRTLVYTVKSTDHLSVIYCDAANIDGRPKIRSAKKTLFIEVPVTALTLTPDGINNAVTVVSGETQEFMCTTDSNRPAAWIHWYLGGRNVTNDAVLQPPQKDGTMFISSSKLIYMGNIQNNNTVVYCEAVQRMQKIKSANKTLHIGYPPDPVVEIKTVCDVASLVIMWRSESNGGNEQIFHVVWQNILSDVEPGFANVSDPGVGSIVHYSAKMLLPNSFYTISVESTNIYGTVRSNKQVYCNTSGTVVALQVKKSSLSLSAGFGSGAALIVSINIVAISAVFISKRRRRAYTDGSNVYEQTKNRSEDSNDYNELNENPKVRPNQTGSGDKTYEDVGVDAIRISNADTKRKKKDKTSKLQNLKEDVRN